MQNAPPPFKDTESAPPGYVRYCGWDRFYREYECQNIEVIEKYRQLFETAFELLDLSFLKDMTDLYDLVISVDSKEDLEEISQVSTITRLDVSQYYCRRQRVYNYRKKHLKAGPHTDSTPLVKPPYETLDIASLSKMTELEKLNIGCFEIEDFSALENLGRLESLTLYNLTKEMLTESLYEGLRLHYTDQSPDDKIRLCRKKKEENGLFAVYCHSYDRNTEEWDFTHGNLIDLSPIVRAENAKILSIYVSKSSRLDLNYLKALPSLKKLTVLLDQTATLTPLGELSHLKSLSMSACKYFKEGTPLIPLEIAFIAKLPKLRELSMTCVELKNLESFSALSNLKELTLNGSNSKEGFGPIRYLKTLKTFYGSSVHLKNLGPFGELHNLEHLDLSNSGVIDLSPLSGMNELSILNVENTKVLNVETFAEIKGLSYLYLANSKVRELAPLKRTRLLNSIDFRNTPITDLSPLQFHTYLDRVQTGDEVDSILPLTQLPMLKRLAIGKFPLEELDLVKKLACCNRSGELRVVSIAKEIEYRRALDRICEATQEAWLRQNRKR